MISLRNHSKFLKFKPTISHQEFHAKYSSSHGHGGCGIYAERPDDEDIKWQWSVRESPCISCPKAKKRGWVSKILKRNNNEEELTNRHRVVEYKPKIWELEYYSYLMPGCKLKPSPRKLEARSEYKRRQSEYRTCGPQNFACKNKQLLISLQKDDELKECTEKMNFPLKEPFCLNQVCGKMRPSKKENVGDEDEFFCLNDRIQQGAKEKSRHDVKVEGKKNNC